MGYFFVSDEVRVLYLKVLLKGCHWFTITVKVEKEAEKFFYVFPIELFCYFCSLLPILKSNPPNISMSPIHHDQGRLWFLSPKHESFHAQCITSQNFSWIKMFSPGSSKYRDIFTFLRYFTQENAEIFTHRKESLCWCCPLVGEDLVVSLWALF